MITVRGKIERGKILALDPVDAEFEGRQVTITIDEGIKDRSNGNSKTPALGEIQEGWNKFIKAVQENQIESNLTDLAHQHDHYLYGTPKIED